MNLWKRFAVAAFVAFLFYFVQIAANQFVDYRYCDQWKTQDALLILLGIALLAGIAVVADALVTWTASPWLRRIFNHLFLLAIASCGIGIVNRVMVPATGLPVYVNQLYWMAVMLLIGYSYARPQLKLDYYTAKICLLFSPAVLMVAMQMFFWSTWSNPPETRPLSTSVAAGGTASSAVPAAEQGKKTPVYFFIFDEWSYLRSSECGKFKTSLKNICAIASESVTYTQSLSPDVATKNSIPRYLFQNDLRINITDGGPFFQEGETLLPTRNTPSIFQMARQHGYATSLVGFYHAYRKLLGDQLDYCSIYELNGPPQKFCNAFLWRLMKNFSYLQDPLSTQFNLHHCVESRKWFDVRSAYRKEMLEILADPAPNDFVFFHQPWPHYPYVTNPDGSYFGSNWQATSIDDYLRELLYLDIIVGDIVATLRKAGKFDDALLVFTSDHGFRFDTNPEIKQFPQWNQRVPLIIKLPGQKTGHVIDKEFSANHLKPLFEAVFAGEKDTETLLKILENCSSTKN